MSMLLACIFKRRCYSTHITRVPGEHTPLQLFAIIGLISMCAGYSVVKIYAMRDQEELAATVGRVHGTVEHE